MDFAASGEILFKARCGAKAFVDSLKDTRKGVFFYGADDEAQTRNHTPQKLRFSGGPTSD